MSDCVNVEIRELLPEFMHGRLSLSERARVQRHLAACEECTSELATLELVRHAFSAAPTVNTASIVAAIPRRVRRAPARRIFSRPVTAWRIAAAISFISLGGVSLVVARRVFENPDLSLADSAMTGSRAGSGRSPLVVAQGVVPAISFGGGVSDLATEDLEALIGTMESLEAAPAADPDAAPSMDAGRISSDTSGI